MGESGRSSRGLDRHLGFIAALEALRHPKILSLLAARSHLRTCGAAGRLRGAHFLLTFLQLHNAVRI